VIRPKAFFWIAALALLTGPADAQRASGLSADLPDTRTLAIQDKVDRLFDAGKFKRAFFIYRHELVPLGDKYAQYMVGYMYLMGMGVDADNIAACAWYRLAAERDTPEFIAVRERLLRTMQDDDIRRADTLFLDLRREFSDMAVLLSSIRKNLRELEPRTGSRLKADSDMLTVIEVGNSGRTGSASTHHRHIRRQLIVRVQLLLDSGEFPELGSDPEKINLRDLDRLVEEKLRSESD
jgi:hypothetical protein